MDAQPELSRPASASAPRRRFLTSLRPRRGRTWPPAPSAGVPPHARTERPAPSLLGALAPSRRGIVIGRRQPNRPARRHWGKNVARCSLCVSSLLRDGRTEQPADAISRCRLNLAHDPPVDAGVGHPAISPSLPDDDAVVGRVIANRYLIEAPCERTQHGSIYRAQYLMTDRTVLLRVLPARAGLTRHACRDAL